MVSISEHERLSGATVTRDVGGKLTHTGERADRTEFHRLDPDGATPSAGTLDTHTHKEPT